MIRVLIGAIVGAIIFFAAQSAMWMGGMHDDFASYSPNGEAILQNLNANLDKDGLYYMPSVDPTAPDAKKKESQLMEENVGKPWAMVFYHTKMEGDMTQMILLGLLYAFIASLVVSLVLYYGAFPGFGGRFFASMTFPIFALVLTTLSNLNWWSFPWSFIKPVVIDLFAGWGIVSLWLAAFVKRRI